MKKLLFGLGILALIFFMSGRNVSSEPREYDNFTKCLTEAGAVMYGTNWCVHCQEQKGEFGKSFKYVDYVNCDINRADCISAGVMVYPTWEIDGQLFPGSKSLQQLSQLSGCALD